MTLVFLYSLALIFMLYNLNDDLKDRSLERHTEESFELKSLRWPCLLLAADRFLTRNKKRQVNEVSDG